ncbi:MAG: nuclear transport factor 2 family protein [Alphaproteobacteria bacterium]|nr:MAG: nuclear transport factor 2 family protein [Alphaproteobacteria bacterium]
MNGDDMFGVMTAVNTYPVAVDSLSWDLFDRVFTNDVVADFGGGAMWTDLESMKRDFHTIHAPFKTTQHYTGNHVITVSGDEAHCFSYVRARFVRDLPGGADSYEANGWYDDRLVRTADGWRISHRKTRSNWSGGNPKVLETMPGVAAEQVLTPLSSEVAAGEVMLVNALRGK